ncbi:ciliogenesis and planar polarity effector 2-like [Physella acuta]|uniref:ciliogenesis and planar polarity effector 2-like n=1 Tax=Physella acuta TaxID=109671 RepID=UPI0027DBAE5F|nr:ciliogenesis and planar polarity effector 2-like [Physella acuta]
MFKPSRLLIEDWLQTTEGSEILRSLSSVNGLHLKPYGLLERPAFPSSSSVEDASYKLVVVGKSSVGKTSTIAKLSGHPIPSVHCETAGIQVTRMYWPVKIAHLNKIVLMNLALWDTGELAVKKFDHILPACKSDVDGILFLFSFVDKGSWEEIPHLISRLTDLNDKLAKIVIGTKFDQYAHSEVSQRELREFESRWQMPVLKISNNPSQESTSGLTDIIPVLNCVCERLWYRDVLKEEAS